MNFINLSEFGVWRQRIGVVQIAILVLCYQMVAADYCSLCKNHVACNNNGSFGEACSYDRAVVKMGTIEKEYIVKLHNRMRNKIALGELPKYISAAKMPCFQWSEELAFLAELNARSCHYGHDECRATDKYRWAGQNIARRGNSAGYENKYIAIKNMVTDWFLEYKDANMSYINSYHNHLEGKKIGHFTVMVNDKNNAVGCAMVRHQEGEFKFRYLVCNYGYTNIFGRPVYEHGPTGSKCQQPHPVYRGLCSTNQIVIPSP